MNLYGTVGVTAFTHNPEAQLDRDAAEFHFEHGNISTNPNQFDYNQWYDLRSYNTEPNSYGKAALAFPLGFGGSFIINYAYRIGIEFVWNLTTTDYIDDVSFTWSDPASLSDIGVVLSSPTSVVLTEDAGLDECRICGRQFHVQRCHGCATRQPKQNDTYGTLQISVSKVVMGSSNFRRNNYNNKRRTVKRRPSKPGSSRMGRGRAKF